MIMLAEMIDILGAAYTSLYILILRRYINDEAKPEAVPYLEKRNELVRTLDPDHVT